jgi:hypothetical protein
MEESAEFLEWKQRLNETVNQALHWQSLQERKSSPEVQDSAASHILLPGRNLTIQAAESALARAKFRDRAERSRLGKRYVP